MNSCFTHPIRMVAAAAVACFVFAGTPGGFVAAQSVASTEATVIFEFDIKPIFEGKCIRCHGPEEQEGDFRIDDRDAVMNHLDPGDSSYSDLYDYVSSEDEESMMPPAGEGGPLARELVDKIGRWIDEGAIWPEDVGVVMPPREVIARQQQEIDEARVEQDRQETGWQLAWEIAGLLHPAVLHFPIALLIAGAFFALIGFRGESPLSDAAYYCLWLGAWTAILTCVSGWSFAIGEKGYVDWQRLDFEKSIDVHRWGGILVATLALLLALFAASARRRDPYGPGVLWKFGLVLLACLTGVVGHYGGRMTHTGLDTKLVQKSEILWGNITGQNEQQPPGEDGNDRGIQPDDLDDGAAAESNGQQPPADPGAGAEEPDAGSPPDATPPSDSDDNGDNDDGADTDDEDNGDDGGN